MPTPGFYSCPDTSQGCDSLELPEAHLATCAADYGAQESEICDLWLVGYKSDGTYSKPVSGTPDPATDWLDPANYDTGADFVPGDIIHLAVIGDKPLPEFNDQTVAKRIVIPTSTTHTLNIDVTDFAIQPAEGVAIEQQCKILNYELIRFLQSRPTVALWFRTIDGLMVGGPDGIVADVTQAGTVFGRGEGTLLTGQIVFQWDSDCDPPAQPEASLCTPSAVAPNIATTRAPKALKKD